MALPFAHSDRGTVGIEWELQLVDQDSNDLRQTADAVMAAAQIDEGHPHPHVHREMLLNTVEIVSGARQTVPSAVDDLRGTVTFLRPVTDQFRIDLASSGTHPFARPAYQRVTNSARYAELVERTQYWGRQMLLYGVHVHVGVESRDKALPLLSALTTRLGHFQSISASSPFWAREDTGYASNRAMVFQQLPTAGIPRQFDRWEDLEAYTDDMIHTGVIDGFDEIRWDVRPSPALGTLENRVFDAATNLCEVGSYAALTHCLVEHFSRMIDAGETPPALPDWFVAENKWRSARYGMDAILILDAQGNEELISETLVREVEMLSGIADDLGCARELQDTLKVLEYGAPYQRQRRVAELAGKNPLDAVVGLMRAEMRADRPLDPEEFLDTRTTAASAGRGSVPLG